MAGKHPIAIYLEQHPGARASTLRLPPAPPADGGNFTIDRGPGAAPFRVVHDRLSNRPYGTFRVYLEHRQIGSQLSRPNADDCQRMLRTSHDNGSPYAGATLTNGSWIYSRAASQRGGLSKKRTVRMQNAARGRGGKFIA